jgi:hypothetical protein
MHSFLGESCHEFMILYEIAYIWISNLSDFRKEKDSVDGEVVGASPPHPLFDGYKLEMVPINRKRNPFMGEN